MALIEFVFILVGVCAVFFCGIRLMRMLMVLFPKFWYPLPENFFTSMGKWAVITGGSEGIGHAYALQLARHGLNVVLISRSREKLEKAARNIGRRSTGRKVKLISADFTKDNIYGHIQESLRGLDVAVLVNNVGILPSEIPCKFLETTYLEEKIHQVINCNVKTMAKMCRIVLPGMVERGRGVILNVSSGIAKVPFPLYTLYIATKVFIERFSQGLQAEYKSKRILVQTVSPFGVSTSMMGYQKEDLITFTAEAFVTSSLAYLKAGDQTYGSVRHAILGFFFQNIPKWVLTSEAFQHSFQEFVKKRVGA
uniref:Hydroxysteroid (17-beta) dehydrogenase 3 n=1 Tax=Electrophorus electricus TaxID=8005 RepID=A0A4W4EXE8_ELEEL